MELMWQMLDGRDPHKAGRALLAQMYRQRTGEDLPEIRTTDRGKPYFPDSPLHFSISHTKTRVFCCLADRNVGMDAEDMDRQIGLNLADRILSPSEKRRYEAAADKRQTLLRFWVLKESYAKLLGSGLGNYLWNTDFDPEDPRIQSIGGCFAAVLSDEKEK